MRTTTHRRTGPNSVLVGHQVPREVLLQFVRNLGFNPEQVAALEVTGRTITVTEYHQHPEHGGRYIAEGTNDGVAAVVYTLTLVDSVDESADEG